MSGLANIASLAAGQKHSVALGADGSVWTWGADSYGQLGRGAVTSQSIPVPVLGLTDVVQVSAGGDGYGDGSHSLAVKQDGTVWAWGNGAFGRLGDGTTTSRSTPAPVLGLTDVRAVAAGSMHSIALKRDGTLWAWGYNPQGQLGIGTLVSSLRPTQLPGITGVVAIATNEHSLAVKQDGTVWAWGPNYSGQLGKGTVDSFGRLGSPTSTENATPAQVPGLANIRAVAVAAFGRSFAIGADGRLWAWGSGQAGTLGDGGRVDRLSPVLIDGLSQVSSIAAGYGHTIAIRTDGTGWGWGDPGLGQLGDGLQEWRTVPAPLAGITRVTQVSLGPSFSAFLREDGTVGMTGENRNGILGDGTYAQQLTSVLVVNETVDGFLDLIPEVPNNIPPDKIPPFFVATYRSGGLSATSLAVDVRGIIPTGTFASATDFGNSLVGTFAAGGYNVYVAAGVPTTGAPLYFQLDSNNNWSALRWPMAEFIRGVALDSQNDVVRAQILQNVDLSQYIGTSILVGYGTDPDEMVRSGRYRTIFTVPTQ